MQPTISIDQRAGSQNPRSTVATVTEIYDYLRLLDGPTRHAALLSMRRGNPPAIAGGDSRRTDAIARRHQGDDVGADRPRPEGAASRGFRHDPQGGLYPCSRRWRAGRCRSSAGVERPEVALDRGRHRPDRDSRGDRRPAGRIDSGGRDARRGNADWSAFSSARATRAAKGHGAISLFSTLYACPNCKISYEELEPRTFSFNSPYGACPTCEGLGARIEFDPDLVLPDLSLSLADRAIAPWKNDTDVAQRRHKKQLADFLAGDSGRWTAPLETLEAGSRSSSFFAATARISPAC